MLDLSGLVRTCQDLSGLVRTCQDLSGLARTCQDLPGLIRGPIYILLQSMLLKEIFEMPSFSFSLSAFSQYRIILPLSLCFFISCFYLCLFAFLFFCWFFYYYIFLCVSFHCLTLSLIAIFLFSRLIMNIRILNYLWKRMIKTFFYFGISRLTSFIHCHVCSWIF